MTQELEDIFAGRKKPKVKTGIVSHTQMELLLKTVKEQQKEIMKRTKIDWNKVNQFVMYPPPMGI